MNSIRKSFSQIDFRVYFVLICIISAFLTFVTQRFVVGDQIYFRTYNEQLSVESIQQLLLFRDKWQWIAYAIIPLLFLIKLSAIALSLSIGCFMANLSISFKRLFKICLIGETIFLIPALIKIIWFWKFQIEYSLNDLIYFAPVSLLNFFDTNELQKWFIYPLQVISLFEVLYWLIVAYGLKLVSKKPMLSTLKIVLGSYGTGLLVWLTFVIFIQLNFS